MGFVAGSVVLAATGVALWTVDVPYLVWSPGPVTEALDIIEVEEGVDSFPPDGELLVLTVLQNSSVNAWELAVAIVDPTLDVYRREAVFREGESNEEYRTRQLGLMDQTIQTATRVALARLPGPAVSTRYRIDSLSEEFPAFDVFEPGDILIEVDGTDAMSLDAIRATLDGHEAGDVVDVVVEREGERLTLQVELAEVTDDDGSTRRVLGVALGIEPPVDIEANNVGGPSAGLMFTLSIIDLLSDGDLTKGHVVAGTGTISLDGVVGGIGGVRQKVAAAEAFGAEYMLVPADDFDEALTAERDDIEIVAVATVDDALDFLDSLEATS